MQQAMRVLEHAARMSIRVASTSSSSTTGRLAAELADYVKRLKRLQELGRTQEFYRILSNAQTKLVKLLCTVLR
jgi:hypothetical protein